MSLKSIRQSYSKFLATLDEAGVKINESQKENLDSFILSLEAKMTQQKESAVKATKKIVTENLEKQYQKVFESILQHQAENTELASKIQNKITQIKEHKKISEEVNNYLDLYVESVLPKEKILDYDRMQKLENIHESLKDLLLVNEDSVEEKKNSLTESFNKDRKALETQIAKLKVQLNESMENAKTLNKKLDSFKAMQLLESKTKDLPAYESRQLKKRFANSTVSEIEHKFDTVLESIKEKMNIEEKEEQASLESEVKNILEDADDTNEASTEEIKEKEPEVKKADGKEETFETIEQVKFNNLGEVELDESDKIDANLMKYWCAKAENINTDIVRS